MRTTSLAESRSRATARQVAATLRHPGEVERDALELTRSWLMAGTTGSWEHEQRTISFGRELFDRACRAEEGGQHRGGWPVATTNPKDLWWVSTSESEKLNVLILRCDDESTVAREIPNWHRRKIH